MTNPFYDPKKLIVSRTGEQAYKDYLARTRDESKKTSKTKKQKQAITSTTLTTEFSLEDLTDFWRVNGVNYRNGIYQVGLLKELLDNKVTKTQDEWVEYSKEAIAKDEFYVGDFPLYHALFSTLFRNKDHAQFKDNIEQARQFLQKMFNDYWLMTLSRIKYKPSGQDLVTHNYGLQDKLEVQENILGTNGYINQINPQNELNAILGSNDVNEINQVYKWITGKDAYLWRVNSKPEKIDERVAGFIASSYGAGLGCGGDPSGSDGALGVRAKLIR